jgi:hypothetical protein
MAAVVAAALDVLVSLLVGESDPSGPVRGGGRAGVAAEAVEAVAVGSVSFARVVQHAVGSQASAGPSCAGKGNPSPL